MKDIFTFDAILNIYTNHLCMQVCMNVCMLFEVSLGCRQAFTMPPHCPLCPSVYWQYVSPSVLSVYWYLSYVADPTSESSNQNAPGGTQSGFLDHYASPLVQNYIKSLQPDSNLSRQSFLKYPGYTQTSNHPIRSFAR